MASANARMDLPETTVVFHFALMRAMTTVIVMWIVANACVTRVGLVLLVRPIHARSIALDTEIAMLALASVTRDGLESSMAKTIVRWILALVIAIVLALVSTDHVFVMSFRWATIAPKCDVPKSAVAMEAAR